MTTPNLQLIEPPDSDTGGQGGSGEAFRETFRVLDSLSTGWMAVLSRAVTVPPALPIQGATYLVPVAATGVWADHVRHLAIFTPAGWVFRPPRKGWIVVALNENAPYGKVYQYNGTEWVAWQMPSTQVSMTGGGTVETVVDAQTALLGDHETRIEILEVAVGGGGGGGGSGPVSPDTFPALPNAQDDEFEGASLDAKWTWTNQGTSTATLTQGSLVLAAPLESAADHMHILEQAISGSGRWRAKIGGRLMADFHAAGLCIRNSGTGRIIRIGATSNAGLKHEVQRNNSPTSSNTPDYASQDTGNYGAIGQRCYYEVEVDATNVYLRISATGVDGTFAQLYTATKAAFIGSPDFVGVYAQSANTTVACVAAIDWFRKMA